MMLTRPLFVLRFSLVPVILTTLVGCPNKPDPIVDPESVSCETGLLTGFNGDFNDSLIKVPVTTFVDENTGADGSVGGSGEGSAGIGAGGSLGQFSKVKVTVEFADGTRMGPRTVDSEKGMVTIVPCGLKAPAVVTFSGAIGSGATYFDESLGRDVSFEGRELRSTITSFDKNVGVTSLSEAATQRAGLVETATFGKFKALPSTAQIDRAHNEVRDAVNAQLPNRYRLDDLTRLPVILNEQNFVNGSSVLTDDQNGIYGAVLAGLVRAGAASLGPTAASPALAINDQLVADLNDARIDLLGPSGSVSGSDPLAYTVDSLWSHLTLHTTLSAKQSGVNSLAQTRIPLARTVVETDLSDARIALPYTRSVLVEHFSDAAFRLEINDSRCSQVIVREFNDVRQKQGVAGVTTDGRTYVTPNFSSNLCNPSVAIPFNVPSGATIASLGPLGDTVLASDGRTYSFSPQLANGPWFELVVDGPRPISVVYESGFLFALTANGEVYQHTMNPSTGFSVDTVNRILRTDAGSGQRLPFASNVVQISSSGGNREAFALTADNELFWIDVRDADGARNQVQAPNLVKLDTGPVCWISGGITAIACDGQSFRQAEPISDTNLPPQLDTSINGVRFFIPGVSGINVSSPNVSTFELWRSTSALFLPAGSDLPIKVSNESRLLGTDGTLRTLDGQVVIQ